MNNAHFFEMLGFVYFIQKSLKRIKNRIFTRVVSGFLVSSQKVVAQHKSSSPEDVSKSPLKDERVWFDLDLPRLFESLQFLRYLFCLK